MDFDWNEVPIDSKREISVFLYQTSTPFSVAHGLGTGAIDLSPYVRSGRMSSAETTVDLTWHLELYGASQPKTGHVLEVKFGGVQYWVGIITNIDDYRLQSGAKSMRVISRTRDAMPKWRVSHRATDIYPTSTPVDRIIADICRDMGLDITENLVPQLPLYTVHSNTQLADTTTWDMLETMLFAAGYSPFIDKKGRLRVRNRDVARQPDIEIPNERLLSVSGSKSMPPITEFQVKWLDHKLSESSQANRVLGNATITAGFFQRHQKENVWFSDDRTQRARNTYMVVKQSANSGLMPVCDEEYRQIDRFHGKITLTTRWWVPILTTVLMARKMMLSNSPDMAPQAPTGVLPTVPVGRVEEAALDIMIYLIMSSIGTGMYEIWGTPYDYVHWRNSTIAYNIHANEWETNPKSVDNDFIMDEEMAQSVAVRELLYEVKSVNSYNISIVDDFRIEQGDILQLNDGSKLYVTDFTRDITPGADAVLNITGFRV